MTVYYKSLVLECGESVYEPAEDSFLLADNLLVEEGDCVLDVGSGCGIIALTAAQKASHALGVDINPEAVSRARENAKRNNITNAEFQVSDLFENVSEKFDLIVFNPPYLPSGEKKDTTVDGGTKGRELIEEFIRNVGEYLTPSGRVLLLVSSLNNLDYVEEKLREKRFTLEVVAEKKLFFEKLYVLSANKLI